jgi:hypothetical protein
MKKQENISIRYGKSWGSEDIFGSSVLKNRWIFWRAVEIRPDFAEARVSLSQALAEQGKTDEAMKQNQEAFRILQSRSAGSGPR